jgi:hypothetical protein
MSVMMLGRWFVRACGLAALTAAIAGCGAARGDTSAHAFTDGGAPRGSSDGGTRPIDRTSSSSSSSSSSLSSPSIDQCHDDADCTSTAHLNSCCPMTCALYAATRARAAEVERSCRGIACARVLVCREAPPRVAPVCVLGACVDKLARRRDRCERDEDCVQWPRDANCCHTCGPRVVTRLRTLDEDARCAAAPPRACFEGDCHPPTVTPACIEHRCAPKPAR